jgi:hypothetical protein
MLAGVCRLVYTVRTVYTENAVMGDRQMAGMARPTYRTRERLRIKK